jgi:1,4-dihydroxy-6-naphthoate synthase
MKLTLGFSPCPNDTFIFDALVNNIIDTQGITFDVRLEDVETLNHLALENTLDITKISYGTLPLLLKNYIVLNSGSALGSGVGPLLITKNPIAKDEIKNCTIAIPGEHTTAHMLFSLAFPEAKHKIFLRYNEVEDFVLSSKEKNIAGVIIHENRFTYKQKGLTKNIDLGEYWEQKTKLPIPLGGIVAKRKIDISVLKKIDGLIKQSIKYAFSNYPLITDYVSKHSQEMEEDVMRKHIDLYVNKFSLDLKRNGKFAIMEMLNICQSINTKIDTKDKQVFLNTKI